MKFKHLNIQVLKNETATLADGDLSSEARVLLDKIKNEGWLQCETMQFRAHARRSGCQPATALGMGCKGIIA